MTPNLQIILTFLFVFFELPVIAQEVIWEEHFLVPGKGVWGGQDGTGFQQNFDGITKWTLEFDKVILAGPGDYAKTVTTSKGRFECRDINAEVIWRSEEIDISGFKNVHIQLVAKETGSGANQENKYIKACLILDDSDEIIVAVNGENYGNWGSNIAEHQNINAKKLQLIVYLNNHYSADKVILDEIIISGEEKNPIVIEQGDVLLSEILFNPYEGGEDYVEIYNASEKEIPLKKLYLASRDNKGELTQVALLSKEKAGFRPDQYLALTKDTNGVFPYYRIECPECFLEMTDYPSFNNDKDFVVLLNAERQVIDELKYSEKMHAPLLADEEGISLERISFGRQSNNFSNWHSATTQSGYGTPGYKNSQLQPEIETEAKVTFEPDSFSPNLDGYNDEYKIHYQLERQGFYLTISIFDAAGRFVMYLAENEIVGTSGTYQWNGEDETGQRQNLGVYIVVVEIFDLFGTIHRFKDGVVLTDILE